MNKAGVMTVFLVSMVLMFLYGVIKLFEIRFESGDFYPQYSSLRSDPLGTRALYESLDKIQGLTVSRNYTSLIRMAENHQKSTVFYLGMSADSLNHADREEVKNLESLMAKGWQAVVFLYPKYGTEKEFTECSNNDTSNTSTKTHQERMDRNDSEDGDTEEPLISEDFRRVSLFDRWGFYLSDIELYDSKDAKKDRSGALAADNDALPGSVSWHTGLHFRSLDSEWHEVYLSDGQPVMIERHFGKGKVILSTDTYLASNEAMWQERHPELLVWLVGTNSNVIFNETHLGIHERPGIAALARRYRLHGLFVSTLLLALLFIWRNSTSLVPRPCEEPAGGGGPIEGKDCMAGFINLLRRNISHHDIMKNCFQEWKKANRHRRKYLKDEFEKIRDVIEHEKGLSSHQQNPVKVYQSITKILSERKIK